MSTHTTQVQVKQKTTMDWLKDSGLKERIRMALPKHMTPDRMLGVTMTELRRTPKLQECQPASFIGAIIQCSQLGLEPGGHLGHVYLIPFENRKKGIVECQVIVGYKGMLELATRSGKVHSPQAHGVCENDFFEFEYGLTPKLRHIPARENRGKLIYTYACVSITGGGNQYEVMSMEEINSIKSRSKNSSSGPWQTDYEEMARKTVIRRLFKYLPVSIEMIQAITLDEAADRGDQNNEILATAAYETIDSYVDSNGEVQEVPQKTKADLLAESLEVPKKTYSQNVAESLEE